MAEKPRTMAADMPQCHAFIKSMMQAFGADHIKTQIKRGMDGLPGFYAEENGHRVGTPMPVTGRTVSVADMGLDKIIDTTKPNWWVGEGKGRDDSAAAQNRFETETRQMDMLDIQPTPHQSSNKQEA